MRRARTASNARGRCGLFWLISAAIGLFAGTLGGLLGVGGGACPAGSAHAPAPESAC